MILQNPPDKATTTHDLFDISMFEIDTEKGMINLTKIAKAFDKRLDVWLKSQSIQDFINAMDDLTPNGGSCLTTENGKGTWATRDVAIEFAQWISTPFKVFCIKKLDELFQTGRTQLREYSHKELLQMQLASLEANERLQLQVGELAPKADYCDKVLQSETLINTTVVAKEYGMSAIRFNQLLHAKGVVYKSGDTWVLYSKYENKGYMKTKTYYHTKTDGTPGTSISSSWTEEGRMFLYELLK